MKRRHLLFIIVSFFLIMFCLTGCNADSINQVRENSIMVKEYNDAIEIYNKVALSFTALARDIDKEYGETESFDERFWNDYNNNRKKVLDNISYMINFEFKYGEIKEVMDRIDPMINDIEIYLDKLEEFQKLQQYSNWKDLRESNDILYRKILSQSNVISKVFDEIYDESIIKKKE